MLRNEKIPFVLAALIGFLTWTVTRAIDRIVETPVVKYDVADTLASSGRDVAFEIENISTAALRDVEFTVLLEQAIGRFLSEPSVQAELPLQVDRDKPPMVSENSAVFTFPELQPGARLRLLLTVSPDATPRLGVKSESSALRLSTGTLLTFLVEHELGILVGLSIAAIFLVGAYLFILAGS